MFITRKRAAAGDDRSPFGDFWFTPLGAGNASGQRVTGDTAMQLGAVYSCVRVLAESFAALPFKLYRPNANGRGRQLITQHWAYRLFARRPNRFQNQFLFREMLQGHLSLRGNAYSEIVEDGRGGIAELLPRHPDRVRVEGLSNGSWRYVFTDADGSQRTLRRDQVWHLRGLSSDGVTGLSPIALQAETIGGALAAQEYGNRFFANDAKPTGGWIEYPGQVADRAARQALTEQIKDAISGQNRHRILTLDRGMKYHEVGVSNKDSQFLESRGYSRTEIAGIFRVPPHMIGDLSRATFSNIEQQSIDFWQNSMLPWCERWEAAVEELIGEDEGLEVEFDFRNLMRGDSASRSAYIHSMRLDGVLTGNECRELEGYDPIEGLDTVLIPINERDHDDPDPNGEAGPGEKLPDAAPAEGDDGGADARLAAVLGDNALRMARRVVGGKAPAADVLSRALAIPEPIAATWLSLDLTGFTERELVASLMDLALKGTS